MRFLVCGAGSIGERHLKNLLGLGHQVVVKDVRGQRLAELRDRYGVVGFTSLEHALAEPVDGVLVCTPTADHVPTALAALTTGRPVFIEKPVADTLEGADRVVQAARERGLVTLVGCNLRFFRSLRLVKRLVDEGAIGRPLSVRASCGYYLPFWHPTADYRLRYSAQRAMGGGVIFDDIHELDYLGWLLGDVREVFCIADRLSSLEIDTEDVAEILLRYESGAVAAVHLDYLQRTYRRSTEVVGEDGVIVWDYIQQTVQLFGPEDRRSQLITESINTDRNEMFRLEIEHFVRSIRGEEKPEVDAAAGRRILEIALAAHRSARERRVIALGSVS